MSYILDALKKSETERARNLVIDPQALQLHPPILEKRLLPWPILLIVLMGLGIGGFYAWKYALLQKVGIIEQSETNIVSPNKTSVVTALVNEDIAEPKPDVRPVIQRRVKKTPRTRPPPKPRAMLPPKQEPVVTKDVQQPRVVFSETFLDGPGLDSSMTDNKPGTVEIAKSSLDEIPNISELPLQVRNEIPSISFDGHVYSGTQSQRSVMINGRKMREGEIVSSNLSLEKITKRGAEFKIDGYRFKLGALQDWSR